MSGGGAGPEPGRGASGTVGRAPGAARAREENRQRQSQAAEAINADPFVRELIEGFGATIVPDSIKPLQGDAG